MAKQLQQFNNNINNESTNDNMCWTRTGSRHANWILCSVHVVHYPIAFGIYKAAETLAIAHVLAQAFSTGRMGSQHDSFRAIVL